MALLTQLNRLKEEALDLLFPRYCVGCGEERSFLCLSCIQLLPPLLSPYCTRCGEPLRQGNLCLRCQSSPPEIEGVRSPFLMEGVMRQAIHSLKYRNLRAMAKPLAGLLREYLEASPLPAEILVPVPLHPRRLRERGYNQSALLARELGRLLGLPAVESSLFRLRDTPSQAKAASAEERRSNVQEAFACPGQGLEGKNILLIDDVCTTGATLEACAVALKKRGAALVWGLTVSRER